MTAASPPAPSKQPPSRWPRWLQTSGTAAADFLFPPHCTFCEAECVSRAGKPLWCEDCQRHLGPAGQAFCPRCAMPCPEADAAAGPCPSCRGRRLLYEEARSVCLYDGWVRQAVLKIKHAHYEPLAAGLGWQLAERVRQRPFSAPPELVVPVPMFWLQRLWRGANAAETVAAALARELALPIVAGLLICRRWLRKQSTLKTADRRRNVRQAFRASRRFNIHSARILLVDDVMTTGATAHEAARALRLAGAGAVYVAAVARSTHEP